jgi:mRNA interferase RelE/StbE
MAHSIEFKLAAWRQISTLPSDVAIRVFKEALNLSSNPRPSGCKKLKGQDAYRIRVGNYRVVYEIHDEVLIVLVIRVAHRREVYQE